MNRIKPSGSDQILRRGGTLANHTNLHFHIDRLTLAGLPRINQDGVVDAMQRRLTTLVTEMSYLNWSQISAPIKINGGEISSDTTSEQLGAHLANEIMRHIARAETRSDLTEPC
jgi:hypothetical protein